MGHFRHVHALHLRLGQGLLDPLAQPPLPSPNARPLTASFHACTPALNRVAFPARTFARAFDCSFGGGLCQKPWVISLGISAPRRGLTLKIGCDARTGLYDRKHELKFVEEIEQFVELTRVSLNRY